MAEDIGGDPDIGGDSVYDGGSLILMGDLFIGGAVTSYSKPPTSYDLGSVTPDFCSDDIFFSNYFCDKLDYDAFYYLVESLHKTGTLATYTAVTNPCGEPPPSKHPVNQYSDSYYSEDKPEPPDCDASGKCHQFGAYGWVKRDLSYCNGLYEPVDLADVSEDSAKEDLECLGLNLSIGELFDSVGGEKLMKLETKV